MLHDHTKENFQHGKLFLSDIEAIEQDYNRNHKIIMQNGDIHIYRCSCVLTFRVENRKNIVLIS
jgi:hypothetical protein